MVGTHENACLLEPRLRGRSRAHRIIVVGFGFAGQRYVTALKWLEQRTAVQLVGIVDSDCARRQAAAPISKSFGDLQVALRETEPTAVIVAVNESSHSEILGELAAAPSRLDWVIPDFGTNKTAYPAEALTRKVELTSVLGHAVELKNATSDIKGLSVQIVARTAGKKFDLVLTFDELPLVFSKGKVTVETSLASLPKVEVPLTISVPSPQ